MNIAFATWYVESLDEREKVSDNDAADGKKNIRRDCITRVLLPAVAVAPEATSTASKREPYAVDTTVCSDPPSTIWKSILT